MRKTILVAGALIALAGCSGSNTASVDAATRQKYVAVEAQRLCDTQRSTYPSQEALEQAFTKAMADSGISEADQKTLREQRETDGKLRAEIDARFASICK